ncbi:MAG: hypothetical protein E7515_06410 [Ruminococcaceae bacterium]|nr:hypothetical protein [Oscillospiraceae bacterium]
MNTNSGFLMCLITAVYVVATLFIMHFNKKSANAAKDQTKTATDQIEEMKRQQQQNAGISLYAIRKSVLTGFGKKEYNSIYWDAVILFSGEVADEILNTGYLYESYKKQKWLMEEYESRMRTDCPNQYDEYKYKLSLTAEHPDDEELLNTLYSLCDSYCPVYNGPLSEQEIVLDYRELSENLDKARRNYELKQTKTLSLINDELKRSIQAEQQ